MPDIDTEKLRAQLTADAHATVDKKLTDWFGRQSELATYDLEAVLELGKHVI